MVELFVQAIIDKAVKLGWVNPKDASETRFMLLRDIQSGHCTDPKLRRLWSMASRWGIC